MSQKNQKAESHKRNRLEKILIIIYKTQIYLTLFLIKAGISASVSSNFDDLPKILLF